MIDFTSYVIFLSIGILLGAVFGRRAMRWYWHGANVADKENVGYWLALACAFVFLGARRFLA